MEDNDDLPLKPEHRRDLELVLLGYALADESRCRQILESLPGDELSEKTRQLIEAVCAKKTTTVVSWFSDRGVVPGSGKNLMVAMIDRFLEHTRREKVKEIVRTLQYSAKVGSTGALLKKCKDIISLLEEQKP